jgi:hypothetical protein
MQISGQLEWRTMSKMIVLAWPDPYGTIPYHHDHILNGRLFGRVDVHVSVMNVIGVTVFSGAAWFTVEKWSQEMSLTSPWPIRTHTLYYSWLHGTYELSFFVELCFLPWHLTPMSGNRISIRGTNRNDVQYWHARSGEVVFYVIKLLIPL